MVVGCHQQPTIAAIFFDNGSHIIGNIPTTSNCDSLEKVSFKPPLPGNAEMRDIAAAIEVVEEGGLQMDNAGENEDDDDGGRGMEGIGIKILEGTTVLGLSRTSGLVELEHSDAVHVESFGHTPKTVALLHKLDHSFAKEKNVFCRCFWTLG
jgi:hypothetical protein